MVDMTGDGIDFVEAVGVLAVRSSLLKEVRS